MKNLFSKLPESPGVYLMKNASGEILYVGKAGNLRRRTASYFQKALDARLTALVGKIKKIDYKKTETALEALILESELIKKYAPPFNIREKDGKSFLYVEITNDFFPRVLLTRGRNAEKEGLVPSLTGRLSIRSARQREERSARFSAGPFTSASAIREALQILRRIFPYSTHLSGAFPDVNAQLFRYDELIVRKGKKEKERKPCFDYQIGLCPGTCVGAISRRDYLRNIKNIELLFKGKKKMTLENLKKEMSAASKNLEFEKAAKIRGQIFALKHIQDIALIADEKSEIRNPKSETKKRIEGLTLSRIEGYDISNISGTSAVGSMVVFLNGEPARSEYRKFKIKTIFQPNDVGMLKEVFRRRFSRSPKMGGWPLPDLILVDGGKGQVNVAKSVLADFGLKLPVIGIAKGPKRKNNKFVGELPRATDKKLLIKVRDEAHRFAIKYHKSLRSKEFIKF